MNYFKTPPADKSSTDSLKRGRSEDTSPGLHDSKKLNVELEAAEAEANLDDTAPAWASHIFKGIRDMNSKMDKVLAKIDDFTEFQTEITGRVVELEKCAKFLSSKYDEQNKDIDELKTSVANIAKENELLRVKNQELFKQVDTNEQHSRNECLLLHGIPEATGETAAQATSKFATAIGDALAIDITTEIKRAHRLGPFNADSGKPRPIIARFKSMGCRNEVFGNKKKLKGSGKVLTENLTAHRLRVMNSARDKYGHLNVWTIEGRITAKKDNQKFTVNPYGYA